MPRPPERHLDAYDVMFLLSCGVSIEEALTRVAWTPEAARRWAERNQHRPLLAAIAPITRHYRKTTAA